MNNETKEILDEMYHIICTYSDDYDYFEENKINFELSYKNMEKLYDYIANLQESEAYYYGQYKDYKSRNEKAIEYCNKEIGNIIAYFDYVDTKDLENVRKILQGEDNTPQENLYKYTPEKGFRLVGDEDVKD